MKKIKTLLLALAITMMTGCTSTNGPEQAVENYFNEINKGIYNTDLMNYYYFDENDPEAVTFEQGYDLIMQQGGDLPEDENALFELINAHWMNIEFKEVLNVEKVNDYTVDVLVKIDYQNLEQLLNDYKNVLYFDDAQFIDYVYQMINDLNLPAYDYENNIYIRLVNPALMEKAGLNTNVPEVKDEWLVIDYYENDQIILLGNLNNLN